MKTSSRHDVSLAVAVCEGWNNPVNFGALMDAFLIKRKRDSIILVSVSVDANGLVNQYAAEHRMRCVTIKDVEASSDEVAHRHLIDMSTAALVIWDKRDPAVCRIIDEIKERHIPLHTVIIEPPASQ